MGGQKNYFVAASMARHRVLACSNAFGNSRTGTIGKVDLRKTLSSVNTSRNYDANEERINTTENQIPPTRLLNGMKKNHMSPKIPSSFVPQRPPKSVTQVENTLRNLAALDLTLEEEAAAALDTEHDEMTPPFESPSKLSFTGDAPIPVTSQLHIVTPEEDTPKGIWPIFRIMDEDGSFRDGTKDGFLYENIAAPRVSVAGNMRNDTKNDDCSADLSALRNSLSRKYPNLSSEIEKNGLFFPSKSEYPDIESKNTLERLLRVMLRLREMDSIFQNAQRQGRISFYLTCRGEEGIHLGAASALESQDVILGQYREQGPLMWRGFTLQQFADQCFSNESDLGKGRQMPIHYGSRALNYQTISSPLGTQIPQAVGVALRLKRLATENEDAKKAVSICFFGEGCTSTTDFHSGLNFAATLKCPVIFFCRNNGYAISTPVHEQYAGDGVVSRAPGYGMAAIRVDGNDVFAVHAAVREARSYALDNSAPVLIEAMSYRQGHHSTSDDSLQYRNSEEIEHFANNSDPLSRLENFLKHHHFDDINDAKIESFVQEEKKAILNALRTAERKPKPPLDDLFTDVYKEMPKSLKAQQQKLTKHISKYPDSYIY